MRRRRRRVLNVPGQKYRSAREHGRRETTMSWLSAAVTAVTIVFLVAAFFVALEKRGTRRQ
jgi:succinate dehydrogenase hydrophobic anchor subunit